jgi:hypothetical protein
MILTRSGLELLDIIERSINKQSISNTEYEEIMELVDKDGVMDDHERQLLRQLQALLENGTLKKVKG